MKAPSQMLVENNISKKIKSSVPLNRFWLKKTQSWNSINKRSLSLVIGHSGHRWGLKMQSTPAKSPTTVVSQALWSYHSDSIRRFNLRIVAAQFSSLLRIALYAYRQLLKSMIISEATVKVTLHANSRLIKWILQRSRKEKRQVKMMKKSVRC